MLCFWNSAFVIRIYDRKKFQMSFIFEGIFFKPYFLKMEYFGMPAKTNPINLKFSGIPFHIKHLIIEKGKKY